MRRSRITVAGLLTTIALMGLLLAALRSGSFTAFQVVYSLTFVVLVFAAIAARYLGAFWYGFAVAGWAYFLLGLVDWGQPVTPNRHIPNPDLATTFVVEVGAQLMTDDRSPGQGILLKPGLMYVERLANRQGIAHSALTLALASLGGVVAHALARRPDGPERRGEAQPPGMVS